MVVLEKNLKRTEMLIEATVKIRAYNQQYQSQQPPHYRGMVSDIQNKQLISIECSCAEHAIISLATAFESFCKELIRELLIEHQNFFISRSTRYSIKVNKLLHKKSISPDSIEQDLGLRYRKEYIAFFEAYSINLLSEKDKGVIEHIYLRRNNYVHNGGSRDEEQISTKDKVLQPILETSIITDAKRLRTTLARMLRRAYDQARTTVEK
jgi:hypothetical protein